MTQHTDMVKKDEQIANLTAVMKTCVCGQKPAPLFAFSSQVDYPTAYTAVPTLRLTGREP